MPALRSGGVEQASLPAPVGRPRPTVIPEITDELGVPAVVVRITVTVLLLLFASFVLGAAG